MKKSLDIMLSILLVLSLLTGCSGNNDNNTSGKTANDNTSKETNQAIEEEIITIKYVLPGTEPKSWPEVKKAVNNKLVSDGVNVQIEHQYIDWAAWDQKLNLMLSTGEEFDMFHVMNDTVSLDNFIGRGAVKDITAEMEQYGNNIKKVIPDDVFGAVTKKGRIYGIPAHWFESSVSSVFTSNDYLLKKYGIDNEPKTPQEMLDAVEKLYQAAPAPKPLFPLQVKDLPKDLLRRTYDSYPFDVRDGFAMITNDGKVKNWIESQEFKQESAFFRQAYQKKLMNPDILTQKNDEYQKQIKEGNWAFSNGANGLGESDLKARFPDATKEDFSLHMFNPEKGIYRFINAKNLNAVAANSKHPEAVVKFLNWLYTSQDNYDLYMYGEEGKTYNKAGERGMEPILDPESQASLIPNSDWMIGNLNFIRVNINTAPANLVLFKQNPDAKSFLSSGFFFDATPVKTEFSNIQAVLKSDVYPIYVGVADYDKQIAQAQNKLKVAGIEKVLAEYQTQLDAYLASNQ